MTWTQIAAIWIIVGCIATPFVGEWIHRRRVNREWTQWLYDETRVQQDREAKARLERLARTLWIAEMMEEDRAFALDEDVQPHLPTRPAA